MLKNASSIGVDAKACQPILGNLGNSSSGWNPVVALCRCHPTRGRRYQLLGNVSDTHLLPPNGTRQCCATTTTSSGQQFLGDGASPQGECPNMPWNAISRRSANPISRRELQSGHLPYFVGHRDVQQLFEAPSDSCVVTHREMETLFGVDNTKDVICS